MLDIILQVVVALLGVIGPIIAKKFYDTQAASEQRSKAQTALIKLGAIAISMAGRAWDKLSPQMQLALADGKITAEERTAIEATVKELLKDFSSEDDLKQIADALGLPVPGIIAKLAAMLIDKFVAANDPEIPVPNSYPVVVEPVGPTLVTEMLPETERPVG